MSQPSPKRHDYDDLQDTELAKWPGVTWSRQARSKHYALVLNYNGVSRFVIYPASPGDHNRGGLNHLRDIRQTLTAMGANRTHEARSQHPHRRRNRTEPSRLVVVGRDTSRPAQDPWARLRDLDLTEKPEVPPAPLEPAPLPLWRRLLAKLFRTPPKTLAEGPSHPQHREPPHGNDPHGQ